MLFADMIFDEIFTACTQSCLFMSYRLGPRFHERKNITSSISGIPYYDGNKIYVQNSVEAG